MRKTILALWAVLLLVTMTLSGCIVPFWWGDEGRGGHGGSHEHGGEHEHHGER